MTSTADTDQHPDVSEISDLTEGLLSASRTADVRHHIDGCALCDDVLSSLEEIRSLLGTLPGSPRMPDDVAGRIDAALAAEALLNATAPAEATSVSRETEPAAEESAGSKPSPTDRPAGRPRGATGPSRRPARRRRRTAVLGAAFGAAVVGVSVFLLQSVQPSQNSDSSKMADRSSSAAEDSTRTYAEGTLERRVDALLSSATASERPGGEKREPTVDSQLTPEVSSADPSAPRNPLRTPAVYVPSCVQQGTGRTTPPLAVEQGIYQGTDAYLVVLPHTSDASRVQAYVVDAACVDATPAAKGTLLLTHSYARS
ncbi:hypothetical protein ACFT7S_28445 [Streptomyces sp. NPDC057136]|uniref:hypothetical protein n=1 Tax=Streptomyces sp. NPDC057136 TaxID=3346029 RepID=UPI0036367FBA